jgi:hypothetical protein
MPIHSLKSKFKYLFIFVFGLLFICESTAQTINPNSLQFCSKLKSNGNAWHDILQIKEEWLNCWGIYKGKNGYEYIGEYRNGVQDGIGTETLPNGDHYNGDWRLGKYHGEGVLNKADGTRYEGIWKNGNFISEKKKNLNTNSQIEVKNDQTEVSHDQSKLEESSKLSHKDVSQRKQVLDTHEQSKLPQCPKVDYSKNDHYGVGGRTEKWHKCYGRYVSKLNDAFKGDVYEGEFRNGIPNGQGTYTSTNGSRYVGGWKDGANDGQGTIIYANGIRYVGSWKSGVKHGQGKIIFSDGKPPIEGIFVNGLIERSEKVDLVPAQGQLPSCIGKDARQWTNCKGVHNFANGDQYEGEFRDGKFNGWGTYYHLANDQYHGDIYAGQFLNGARHGSGRYDSRNNASMLGIWSDGSFVRAEKVTIQAPINLDVLLLDTLRRAPKVAAQAPADLGMLEERKKLEEEKIRLADERRQMEDERKRRETAKASAKIEINITATEPDSNGLILLSIQTGVDTSSLKINGDEQGGNERGAYQIKRLPKVGQDTTYNIVAVDGYGNSAQKSLVVKGQSVVTTKNVATLSPETLKKAAPQDAVAIIIGIADYKKLPRAEFANDDARSFYDYANRALGIKPENIKMLIDGEAEQVDILSTFRSWLPSYVKKDKTDVYVFYSGHGLPSTDGKSLFFLPQNGHKDFLPETGIDQTSLVAALVAAKPKSVTLFIDSCYSGSTRSGETMLASARPIALKASETVFPNNFTVISASRMDQISSSSPELKHGIFSFYVMKGMEGEADLNKDGKITAGELQSYLADAVPRQAMKMGRKQEPQLVGDAERVLVNR